MIKTKSIVNKHYIIYILLILSTLKPVYSQKTTVKEVIILDTNKELLNNTTEWFSFNKSKKKWQYKNNSDNFYFDLIKEVVIDDIPKNHKVISLNKFNNDIEEKYAKIYEDKYKEKYGAPPKKGILYINLIYKKEFKYENLYLMLYKEDSVKYYKVNFDYHWTSH
ncbi:hypothetical protein HX057_07235 [Myroides odoratimimus]|uniref:Beta-lactamase-inhibitor-like PepSY-like domain-containing protein n=1 Tax=Myroides odoratimimus CIP 101113 TaxID=883154 RepID=A0AAV3F3R6_9FLAO|nr:hypothetical protein [Myroides odoratimimus]EHO10167.1 hypothetical protein HMPREF9714_01852 [Myroides odoratimimus CCUG 12901]EHO12743.1 hypothetical protein HMPREF9715_01898 [Myroides odoratimimus CIP 101113]MDM1092969.1 hypothetical protein [Myroides odoratimimus]MDM1414732.1 hypothetical protein [Myroides odoratimimus]MDM1446542.1 hypothetical protein [Myroides odoratimimus]